MANTPFRVPVAVAGVVIALLVGIGLLRPGDTITADLDDGGTEDVLVEAPDGAVPFICNELPDGGQDCRYCPPGTVNFEDAGVCVDESMVP